MNKEVFGLREKIAVANSEQEIVKLLKVGNEYEFASSRTRSSWKNTAFKVLQKLKENTSPSKTEDVPKKIVKSKGKKIKS